MSRIITISLGKQLEQVRHQLVHEYAQEQDEWQVQPMGNELVNAPNMDATHRGKTNEQHQNVMELVM